MLWLGSCGACALQSAELDECSSELKGIKPVRRPGIQEGFGHFDIF